VDACSSKVCCSYSKANFFGFCKRGGNGYEGGKNELDDVRQVD